MPVVCTIIASLSLSALWGPFYSVFLSLSSRRRRRRRRPISFIQLTPDGEEWDNENEETTSLFLLSVSSPRGRIRRERGGKTRKLRNCARKSFSFTPRLFLHACYFSWPVCCLPETGISRRKNIFFLKIHIKLKKDQLMWPFSSFEKSYRKTPLQYFPFLLSPSLSLYNVPTRGLRGVSVAKKQIRVTVPRGLIYSRRRRELGRKDGGERGLQDHHHLT